MAISSLELAQRKKMFLLSFISEVGGGTQRPDLDFMLKLTMQEMFHQLRPDLGHWDLIWGPAVYQTSAYRLADNVIYVAREKPQGQIAIAIAGTNPNSVYDWVVEDLHIEETVPWPYGTSPPGAAMSKGTQIALNILTSLAPRKTLPGGGTLLAQFLADYVKQQQGELSLVTTGHSLGGAVSPLIALWLADTQAQWDPEGKVRLSNYAFAGPMAANRALAEYADQRLGKRINRVANDLDTSPLGWSVAGLERAKTVYQPAIPPSDGVYENLSFRQLQAAGLEYTHFQPDAAPLRGSINYHLISPSATPYQNYQAQSQFQHMEAYFTLLQMPQYLSYQTLMRLLLNDLAWQSYYPKVNRFLQLRQLRHLTTTK